jgi:hypothetical protein
MNIVESLRGQFSTELCNKLGGLVGANESDMRKLIDVGIPCVLASLALISSKPGGSQSIAKALDGLDPKAFGSVEKMLESGAMNSGGSLLCNMLGSNLFDQITTTVSTYIQVNVPTIRIGMGYLSPLVLGAVGAETVNSDSQACSATSVTNLFRTHHESILSAIPDKLPLKKIPSFQAYIKKAAQVNQELSIHNARLLGPSLVSLSVLGTIAVAGLFVFDRNRANERQDTQRTLTATNARPRMVLETMGAFTRESETVKNEGTSKSITSIKSRVEGSANRLVAALESINDTSVSEANSKTLGEAISNLDALAESTKSMPSEGRYVVASLAKSYSKQLNPLIETVLQLPELSDSIRKSLLQVRDKLQAMAG